MRARIRSEFDFVDLEKRIIGGGVGVGCALGNWDGNRIGGGDSDAAFKEVLDKAVSLLLESVVDLSSAILNGLRADLRDRRDL